MASIEMYYRNYFNETNKTANALKNVDGIVISYFIRVLKNHNLYQKFNNVMAQGEGNMRHRTRNKYGAFIDMFMMALRSKDDAIPMMRDNDKYFDVTVRVNNLLRRFLEGQKDTLGVSMRTLPMLGEEIFELACYKIYGNEFLEEMNRHNEMVDRVGPENAQLFNHYLALMSAGRLPRETSFESFVEAVKTGTYNL